MSEKPSAPAGEPVEGATYPCDDCGAMRTRAQGGTVFTVCDACWDRRYPAPNAFLDYRDERPAAPQPEGEPTR